MVYYEQEYTIEPSLGERIFVKRIILDCDNTMGVRGCDVDDGLALLYLVGNPERCAVEGLCTSFGNSDIDTVDGNTRRLLREWGLDLPVFRGAAAAGDTDTDAARFLAEACAESPGEISALVTGSTTNLLGAWRRDPSFFHNVANITFMGGITESLVINGRIMDELNLSCDPKATLAALSSPAPVAIATAQHCLPAHVTRKLLGRHFSEKSWLARTIDYWFAAMGDRYAWDGFAVWDQVAAAALVKPELFEPESMAVTLDERMLSIGYLEAAAAGAPQTVIATPAIADAQAYLADALTGWRRGCEMLGLPL